MNLTLFFRLIVTTLFQRSIQHCTNVFGEKLNYNSQMFYCPKVYAKDGFNVSLQIHNGNYCESENGYRILGHTWQEVEFGFPSENEKLLHKFSEMYGYGGYDENGSSLPFDSESFSCMGGVGKVPVSVLEEIFEKRGGIDWDKTISVEAFEKFTK